MIARHLLSALAVVAALVAAPAAWARDGGTAYHDRTGESASAPDISSVSVTDLAGRITIRANMPGAACDESFSYALLFDVDRNRATGDGGVDFVYSVAWQDGAPEGTLTAWTGRGFIVVGEDSDGSCGGGFTFSIGAPYLAVVGDFDFAIVSQRKTAAGVVTDAAPDSGMWTYEVGSRPVLASLVARVPRVGATAARYAIAVSGVRLSNGVAVPPDSVACTATLAGRALQRAPGAACAFRLRPHAARKPLVVRITVGYGGVTRAFVLRALPLG